MVDTGPMNRTSKPETRSRTRMWISMPHEQLDNMSYEPASSLLVRIDRSIQIESNRIESNRIESSALIDISAIDVGACERCQTGEDDRLLGGFVCSRKGCTGAVYEGLLPTVAVTASAAEPSSEPPPAAHQSESKNKRKKAKGKPKPKPAAAEASTSAAGSDANAASTSTPAPPPSSNGAAASEVPIGYCNECRHAVELTANYAALAQAENAFQRVCIVPRTFARRYCLTRRPFSCSSQDLPTRRLC